MFYVTREVGENVFLFDDSDNSLELVHKQSVLDILGEVEIDGIEDNGNVTKAVVVIDSSRCNWLSEGRNIWDEVESIEVIDENDGKGFSTWLMRSGGSYFKFKETYNDKLLFVSNILVEIDENVANIIQSFTE